MSTYTIGIDLGGTNLKGGVCDERFRLVSKHSIDTEADGGVDHVLQRMAMLVDALCEQVGVARTDLHGIGVGAPGPMSHSQGLIYHAPNLPGWINVPARDRLTEMTGCRVELENDANAAAFGEFSVGAGSDARDMVMLTLGTGIGGGVVLDGTVLRGRYDNAGEIGHMIVVPGGRRCPCGQYGCYERYASANAVGERLRQAVEAGEPSTLAERVRSGQRFDARDVLAAQEAGDALATRIWDETCYYLAIGIVNIQHVINPELVVLAGGLIQAGDKLLVPTRAHYARQAWQIAPDAPRIALATLGTDAGIIGAAALARPS